MKRTLAALLLIPALALGAGNDLLINQRNPADTSTLTRAVSPPSGGGVDGIMGYNGSANVPTYYRFGSGIALSSGAVLALPQAWADISGKPAFATIATSGAYSDLIGVPSTFTPASHTHAAADIASGTFATTRIPALAISQTTGLQTALDGKFSAPAGTAAQYIRGDGSLATLPAPDTGTVTSIAAGTGLSGGTITTTGTISMPNTGAAGSYANVTTDAQGRVTAGTNRSFANPARSLNATFQISASRDAWAVYTVDISVTSLLLAGTSGRVYLDYTDDSGMTTNLVTVNSSPNATGGVLNVTNLGSGNVTGFIPAGKYARIRTANISGTATFTFVGSQEVLQ